MSLPTEPGITTEEPAVRQKVNFTLLAILFVAGVVLAFAVPNLGVLVPSVGTPVEDLTIYRVEFREGEIVAHVLNTGPLDTDIRAVQVGGPVPAGLRDFRGDPSTEIPRLRTVALHIPYEWVDTIPYEIIVVVDSGAAFSTTAVATPHLGGDLRLPVMLGLFVGVIPVFLGIAPLPWFRQLGPAPIRFLGGLAAGVLVFLLVDTLTEAAEIAERLPLSLGPSLVVGGFLLGLLGLVAAGRAIFPAGAGRMRSPMGVAYMVAIAIGLHNFGEGLAIGAAQASGALAFAALLAVGFALHNVTEGVAIVAPALRERFGWKHPVGLGLIAGVPVIPGAMLSFTFYSDTLATFFFALAVGAILYVVAEILFGLSRDAAEGASDNPVVYGGVAAGIVVMYATAVILGVLVGGG